MASQHGEDGEEAGRRDGTRSGRSLVPGGIGSIATSRAVFGQRKANLRKEIDEEIMTDRPADEMSRA